MSLLSGSDKRVILHRKPIYDLSLQQLFTGDACFNAVCFSSPITQMLDPASALRVVASLLKADGLIYVPHVALDAPKSFQWITDSIFHQGSITDVQEAAADAGLEVLDDLPASGVD